ncbi:peptidylprolyl isomerase [Ottowia sp.]|uniref:FKBP-type peptidyl-prolyl cis-trans isomerase n=1 Tax=Ottowia sp. TaxID=1898956 RepID=UPI002C0F7897|nr:peptidylprolyl isomerase [Ottowia sp.]HRN74619.1 FKBP-type peptidyl-prolyl cis-trans isomerase [Ottowia sp.]HRQ01450.1 FKBP-type peptidyl-prolyl cis-trans isomerase [Ottowia sp.]
MEISSPCVVALTWTLKDSLGDTLDELDEPVEFLVGGDDLLPAIERALQGHEAGAVLHLNLEPEDAFGDFDEQLVFLAPRQALPEHLEEGMLIEAASLPAGAVEGVAPDLVLTITEIYPEHVVLDANHPLAGIALRLQLKVVRVREAEVDEVGRGSAGTGFFRLQPVAPGSDQVH